MYIDFNFSKRLSELRAQKGVSARDMSLSLGQNPTYIHKIENGLALPSMMGFSIYVSIWTLSHPNFSLTTSAALQN